MWDFLTIGIFPYITEFIRNSSIGHCYKAKNTNINFIVTERVENSIPHLMNIYLRIKTISKLNNKILDTVTQIYDVEKITGECIKAYAISGPAHDDLYHMYEVILYTSNFYRYTFGPEIDHESFFAQHIIEKFIVEVYRGTNVTNLVLPGMYGLANMEFDYERSDKPLTNGSFINIFFVKLPRVFSYHSCLFLQHDKLWMSIPLQDLRINSQIFHDAIYVEFKYRFSKNGVQESVILHYNSWVYHCQKRGFPKFDFVVREKIDQSLLEILFLGNELTTLGSLKYKFSVVEDRFVLLESNMANIVLSVTLLEKAIKNPLQSHIYLDNFEVKHIKCDYNTILDTNCVVKQFGVKRYHTYMRPSTESSPDGLIPWLPLDSTQFLEMIANERIICDFEKAKKIY